VVARKLVPPDEAILVYQMGKVGSSTIHESLLAADLQAPVYKTHYLSEQGQREGKAFYDGLKRPVPMPYGDISARLLRAIRSGSGTRWKVVTAVRDPVARDVSQFVQLLDLMQPGLTGDGAGVDPHRVARAITAQFLTFDERSNYTCRWFDTEIRQTFGVDVLDHPFHHEAGYTIIDGDRADILVLRLEDLDRSFGPATQRFLGLSSPLPMVRHSSRRPSKLETAYTEDVYSRIVPLVTVPRSICDRVYATRYARRFYTESERAAFIRRWCGAG
jgi:hypothetical protein